MPIYEYICLDCKNSFEALRQIKDADEGIECTDCGSKNTSRTISIFFAQSGGKNIAGSDLNCSSCASRSCGTCGK